MSVLRMGLRTIADTIARKKGTFVLAKTESSDGVSNPFALAIGSTQAVRVNGGFTIMVGLGREQVEKLRAMCDAALAEPDA